MGEMIEFPSNGSTGQGYLATPESGSGPGVVVIQEWWGLVPHIENVCDRFAAEGFVALAPDLYHGEKATEPDEAQKKMMCLQLDKAAKDMSGAVDALGERSEGSGVGVVGFCMGGGLALKLAAQRPDAVKAVAAFYGAIPWENADPDYGVIKAATVFHVAEKDDWVTPELAEKMAAAVREGGNDDVEVVVHPGTEHAFFNDDRPEVHNPKEAAAGWEHTLRLFRGRLA